MKRYALAWALQKWSDSSAKAKRNILLGIGAFFVVGFAVLILSVYLAFSLGGMAIEKLTSIVNPTAIETTQALKTAKESIQVSAEPIISNESVRPMVPQDSKDLLNQPIKELVPLEQIQQGANIFQKVWSLAMPCQIEILNVLNPEVFLSSSIAELWTKLTKSCLTFASGHSQCQGVQCGGQKQGEKQW